MSEIGQSIKTLASMGFFQIQFPSILDSFSLTTLDFVDNEIVKKIQSIVISIFSKMSDYSNAYKNSSNEISLKPIAMISCLSLIALLVLSFFRKKDSRLVPPPTPQVGKLHPTSSDLLSKLNQTK